jgi:hypothetical protein
VEVRRIVRCWMLLCLKCTAACVCIHVYVCVITMLTVFVCGSISCPSACSNPCRC